MFRSTPFANTPTFKLVVGFGLCTLGGAMLYAYFKSRDDEDPAKNSDSAGAGQPKQQKQPEVSIKLVVANEHIPLMVGRHGANLTAVQEKTCTKIRLRDKDDAHKFVDITGVPDAVKLARAQLLKEVERAPIVKEEVYVPQSVCGKITGRCGEAMQEICRISLAKVSLDAGGRTGGGMDRRRIVITGNRQQVNIARKLIEDKIEEDENLRRAVDEVEQRREPRRSPSNSVNSSLYSSQTSLSSHLPPREKMLAAKADEKPMEVYVSAIASPAKFWVQLIGPQSKQLDDMVQAMTDYYGSADNRAMHGIQEPYLGQIVAAVFKYDGKWYRAEIVGILPNQYNPSEVVLDLYFVDYGDSEYVAPHEVFELRTDFLTLRFQAVECFLANVKSTIINDPDTWDSQSIQKFEEVTQVANWKKMISRVVTYKDRPKAINGAGHNSVAREGSPIPGVELFDLTEGVEVNIGHMLISHGFAFPATNEPRPRSPHCAATPDMSSSMSSSQNPPTPPSPSPECLPQTTATPTATATTAATLPHNARAAEDALFSQQLDHLQKNNNLYLKNGDDIAAALSAGHPAKLSSEFFNGAAAAAPSAARPHNLNGGFIR